MIDFLDGKWYGMKIVQTRSKDAIGKDVTTKIYIDNDGEWMLK